MGGDAGRESGAVDAGVVASAVMVRSRICRICAFVRQKAATSAAGDATAALPTLAAPAVGVAAEEE